MARILGIESSCDETAAAVVEDGARILSNVISSQIDLHRRYGGVVPELASRAHLERIVPVVREAFEQAGLRYGEVDAIAVTQGPGLVGALLVGVTYAKALATALRLPLIGVNHLEGHIHACLLEEAQKGNGSRWQEYPVVTLVVSGGHTSLYLVSLAEGANGFPFTYRLLGKTLDDAAGEAYDKVAKLLGLGYPGGPVIDRLAPLGNPKAVAFTRPKIKSGSRYNFSFSGIKTAVARYVEKEGMAGEAENRSSILAANPEAALAETCSPKTRDLLASFQAAVVRDLAERTLAAAEEFGARAVFVSGGVAANSLLRKVMAEKCGGQNLPLVFPSVILSTDNAAMIAAAAYPRYQAGEFAGAELNASATLPLGA